MIKAVIFDMDGLMFDTEKLAVPIWSDVSKKLGYDMSEEFILKMFGRSVGEISDDIHRVYGEDYDTDSAWRMRKESLTEWIDQNGVPLKPGLKELLVFLKEQGIKMAVATSTELIYTEHYLKLAGIDRYFDAIATGQMVEKGKPEPDIYLYAAKQIDVNPKNCLALEDAPAGIRSAFAAGMHVIMIPDMIKPVEDDSKYVDRISNNLREVIDFVKLHNK